MLVPFSYNLRSLFVRRASTLLTVFAIGATVAVVAGVLALQQGFALLYTESGREDLVVFLRPGSTNEGDSIFSRDRGLKLMKTVPEIAMDEGQQPLASLECYLAVRRFKMTGGETNVAIRGVQPMTFTLREGELEIVEGRNFQPGADEVIVGRKLVDRIQDCHIGDVIQLNTTPFKVVGVFATDASFDSEIWGDLDRMLQALKRYGPNRVLAKLVPGTDPEALAERLLSDREVPAKVLTEREYLSSQTKQLSKILVFLGAFLGVIMGIAAVFTATNTMLSALAARSHEIGILLATGFRPVPIFLSFMLEALLLGLLGGGVGILMTLPINGIETGAMNFNTFTEVAFAFRITPQVLVRAILFALTLGLLGGALPAWRAARLSPTEALRRT
ncbi:MAG: FtsX-like permease family protein [Planctomycetota bacterium]|nr:MAG: FtsX-like permease family protein [Planctomycetota bacterium]